VFIWQEPEDVLLLMYYGNCDMENCICQVMPL